MFVGIFLLCIGIFLILFNIKAVNREKTEFQEILKKKSVEVKDYEIQIGKLRKEFAETLLEIQSEVLNLKNSLERNKLINHIENQHKDIKTNNDNFICSYIEKENDLEKSEVKVLEKENDFSHEKDDIQVNNVKVNEIKELIEKGLSMDEISDELKINKGEVLLIKDLYLK